MGKYRIGVSETDLLTNLRAATARDDLMQKLNDIEKKYQSGKQYDDLYPDSLGLEKLEYTPKSDEELTAETASELDREYEDKLNSLRAEYEEKRKTAEAQQQSVRSDSEAQLRNLQQEYGSAKKSLEDNALNRGLARSSVVIGQLGALERDRADAATALVSDRDAQLRDIGNVIVSLEAAYDEARAQQKEDYARDLAAAVNALKQEQQERLEEVKKYNNQIAEKETEYQVDRAEAIAKQVKEDLKDPDGLNARKEFEKAQAIRDYLDSMPKEAALAFLKSDPDIRQEAGSYYDYLYQYTKLR